MAVRSSRDYFPTFRAVGKALSKFPPTNMSNVKKAARMIFKKSVTQHEGEASPKELHKKLLDAKAETSPEARPEEPTRGLEKREVKGVGEIDTSKTKEKFTESRFNKVTIGAQRNSVQKPHNTETNAQTNFHDNDLLSLNERMTRDIDLAKEEKPKSETKLLNFKGRAVVNAMTMNVLNRVLGFVESYRLSKDVHRAEKHDEIMSQKEYAYEEARIRNEQTFIAFDELSGFFNTTDKGLNELRAMMTADRSFSGMDFDESFLLPVAELTKEINTLKEQYLDDTISDDDFQKLRVLIDQRNVLMREGISKFSEAYATYLKPGNKYNLLPKGLCHRLEMLRGETFSGQKAMLLVKEERMLLGDMPTFEPKLAGDSKGIIQKIKLSYQKHKVDQKQKQFLEELRVIRTRNYQDAMKSFEAHRILAHKKGGYLPSFKDIHSALNIGRMGAVGVVNILKSAALVSGTAVDASATGGMGITMSGLHAGLELAEAGHLLSKRGKHKRMEKISRQYVENFSVHKKVKKLNIGEIAQKEKELKAEKFLKEFYQLSPPERSKMRDLGAIAVRVTRTRNVKEKDEDIAYHAAKGVVVGASAAVGAGILVATVAGASTGYGAPIALSVLAGGSIALTTGYISYKAGKAGYRLYQQMQWQDAQKLQENLKHEQQNLESLCAGFPDIKEMKGKSPYSIDQKENENKILKSDMYSKMRLLLDQQEQLKPLSSEQKDAIALSSCKLVLIGGKLEEQSRYKLAKEASRVEMKHGLGKDLVKESQESIDQNIRDVIREHTIHKSDDAAMGVLFDRLKEEERAYAIALKSGQISIDESRHEWFPFRNFISELAVKDKYVEAVLNSNDREVGIELLKRVVLGVE